MNQASPTDLYIAGRMSEEDARLFEENMLVNPAIAAEVDVRRRIKSGLRLLESRGELAAYSAVPRPRIIPWAAAASAVLVVIAAAWFVDQRGHTDTGPGTTQYFSLVSVRSAETPVLRLEITARTISLRTMLDEDASPPYSMRIQATTPGKRTIELSGDAVKLLPGGEIEGLLDADELAVGRYELIVGTGAGASQPIPFDFEK
jgi:hypothetical protein